MSVFNSISVSVLLVLLVAGLMMGLSVSGIDLLNPNTSAAEANRINVETAHQQATYELQEQLSRAQTEAEIQDIHRQQDLLDAQYKHDIQLLNQDLENRQTAFNTKMQVSTMFGGALSIALIIATSLWVGSKALANLRSVPVTNQPKDKHIPPVEMIIPNQPEQEFDEQWHNDEFRKAKIEKAREKERTERLQKLNEETELMQRMQSISDPARIETGKYNNLPLGV